MKSVEFVEALADIMEVERTELATVDRALAKAGLRQVARGKSRPDITLQEGLQIAFGWAGVKNLTEAAEEIERLMRFEIVDEEPETRSNQAYIKAFGGEKRDLAGQNFLDVAAKVARSLGDGKLEPRDVWVSIEKDGEPSIHYKRNIFQKNEDRASALFVGFGKLRLFSPRKVKVTVEISGQVLKWIHDVTEGA